MQTHDTSRRLPFFVFILSVNIDLIPSSSLSSQSSAMEVTKPKNYPDYADDKYLTEIQAATI